MTQQRHKTAVFQFVFAVNSISYLLGAYHLKSWASVKRACQFKSGPGQFPLSLQILILKIPGLLSYLKKSQKERSRVNTDTTMTQRLALSLGPIFNIISANTENILRGLAYGHEGYYQRLG